MAQHPLELILLRQLASYLAIPIWVTDDTGNLVYYNEPAEQLLGLEFGDAGPIDGERLAELFQVTDQDGTPIGADELPIAIALDSKRPSHGRVRYKSIDGVSREVEVTAVPITGQGDRFIGAMATFWETAG